MRVEWDNGLARRASVSCDRHAISQDGMIRSRQQAPNPIASLILFRARQILFFFFFPPSLPGACSQAILIHFQLPSLLQRLYSSPWGFWRDATVFTLVNFILSCN